MAYFPMFVNLTDSKCLVVGGGNVAYRKIKVLLDFEAYVYVVAKDINDEIRALAKSVDRIFLEEREFSPTDLKDKTLVVAATSDNTLNSQISSLCKTEKIPVNVVDCSQLCSFIFPSYLKEQNLVGAFSSSGNSPVITQMLRDYEKKLLTPKLGEINEQLGKLRPQLIEKFPIEADRKQVIKHLIDFALTADEFPTDKEFQMEIDHDGAK